MSLLKQNESVDTVGATVLIFSGCETLSGLNVDQFL